MSNTIESRSASRQPATADAKPLIPATWNLPEGFRRRLGSTVGRQRLMQEGQHLLLVVHRPPEADENSRRGRLLWRDAEGAWRSSDGGAGPSALRSHLDEFAQKLALFETAEAQAQRADDYLPLLEGLLPVVRAARNLHQVLEDARHAMPDDRHLIDARDNAYELARNAELLYDDLKNAMDVAIVRRAEEQAKSSQRMAVAAHRLNILAALFFPLATLSAAFGTTLPSGFESFPPPTPWLILVTSGFVLGYVLVRFVTRYDSQSSP